MPSYEFALDVKSDSGGRSNHTDTRVRVAVRKNGCGASRMVHRDLEIRRSTPVDADQKHCIVSGRQQAAFGTV
jgi:hypothetical protein